MEDLMTASRKIFFTGWLLFLAVFVLCCSPDSDSDPAAPSSVLTLRNLTAESVVFTIEFYGSDQPALEHRLEAAEQAGFPGGFPADIRFSSGEELISYRLRPGTPYNFRYDENDRLNLYEGSHARADVPDLAPFVTTPKAVVEKMLRMAEVARDDVVYDLGCGDGRIVISAAEKYGARGVGIDLDPQRIAESKVGARNAGVEHLVGFINADVAAVDLSQATVVTMYLLTESNALLRPQLERQLRPGTRVLSHNYEMPGWEDKEAGFASVETEDGEEHLIFFYRR